MTQTRVHTPPTAHIHTNMHTHTHPQTHTLTHTQPHTHTHTHTCSYPLQSMSSSSSAASLDSQGRERGAAEVAGILKRLKENNLEPEEQQILDDAPDLMARTRDLPADVKNDELAHYIAARKGISGSSTLR